MVVTSNYRKVLDSRRGGSLSFNILTILLGLAGSCLVNSTAFWIVVIL